MKDQINDYKSKSLMPAVYSVMCQQNTEAPFSGKYAHYESDGTYVCRCCGWALFRASAQFETHCGWPSFDEAIDDHVVSRPDWDEQRIEICCARCDGHLGHLFVGEELTPKNRRYCVNSCALDLVASPHVEDTEEALVAGGCFWGVEHLMRLLPGVLSVEVGYMGGTTKAPTYEDVCTGSTGHYEVARVLFDPYKVNYRRVLQRFFEIHDPTQADGQGPDRGSQYQSAVFFYNEQQQTDVMALLELLELRGYHALTQCVPATVFWPAEESHQQYFLKHPRALAGSCHVPVERFNF